jgi:hypothetical protein
MYAKIFSNYGKKVKTVICNNYTNINNHLSPSLTEYRKKNHGIGRWISRFWLMKRKLKQ